MGTGKTAVGRLVAAYDFLPFHDTDSLIEAQAGKKIATIFKAEGEAAFRELEHRVLVSLELQAPAVVALGGGAVLREDNREILKRGTWINLRATPTTIEARVAATVHRPLIKGQDPRGAIERLLYNRAWIYDQAPIQIQTDWLSPQAVADDILKAVREKK